MHGSATSVDVERVFSQGRILISHVRNRLSSQTIRALLCLGKWSKLGFIKTTDILAVTKLAEVDEDVELPDGWDKVIMDL